MEDKQVSRLGSTVMKKIDVRIVAATNQDLAKLIRENRFRQDLYHRINTFVINVPPLRQRPESIPHLFSFYLDHFAKKFGRPLPGVDKEIIEALQQYDFPGNVRELKHMIERALILCEGDVLTSLHFDHLKMKTIKKEAGQPHGKDHRSLVNIEKESIEEALRQSGNNKSHAARLLNISRQALDRKLEKLGIVVSR
jgi:transcriptional regulator with PAS, ATPase and Fis domain